MGATKTEARNMNATRIQNKAIPILDRFSYDK